MINIDNGERHVYFTVTLLLGDNLGVHTLLGLTESFSSNNFCRFCYTKKDVTHSQHVESLVRTKEQYDQDVELGINGVKHYCMWNELSNFHIITNMSVDIMHDIYEGVARYELGYVLNFYVFVNKFFTLDILNARIKYFNFIGNKPPSLSKASLLNKYIILSASEMKNLLINLPLIIGDLVPQNDNLWNMYTLLLKIVDIVECKSILPEYSILLKTLISEHHKLYVELIGALKPKHHFLIHYPAVMKCIGPLTKSSSIRFEGRHQDLKNAANATTTRKNILYTLAMKCQLAFCNRILSQCSSDDNVKLGSNIGSVSKLYPSEYSVLLLKVGIQNADKYDCTRWVSVASVLYRQKSYIVIDYVNFMPIFAKIEVIAFYQNSLFFILTRCKTMFFDTHYQVYEITPTKNYVCSSWRDIDSQSYNCHLLPDGRMVINTCGNGK